MTGASCGFAALRYFIAPHKSILITVAQRNVRQSARPNSAERITERPNPRSRALDTRSTIEILRIINSEDRKVARAVARVIPQIARAVDLAGEALARGGRLVYLGAGTSGRLGVLDAAECLPTFGTEQVVGVMAGAPDSMFRPTEVSEDEPRLAERDLRRIRFSRSDILVAITASGRTPYAIGGLRHARRLRASTVLVTSNADAPASRLASVTIAPVTGPEVITGSTRMKAGTAQKLVLNMISTAAMVRQGRVFSNLMVCIQLSNAKLRKRGERIFIEITGARAPEARKILGAAGNRLPVALLMYSAGVTRQEAEKLLESGASPAKLLREGRSRHSMTVT